MKAVRLGPLVAASTLLGVGLGGFLDGILFHQILQWHNMLSSWVPPVDLTSAKVNMFWDGLFHAFTWTMTVVGLFLLWRAVRREDVVLSSRAFAGALLLGFGLFNFVEGLIDHQLLGVHHVHPGTNELAWDIGYLLSGVVLMASGVLLIRSGKTRHLRGKGARVQRSTAPTAPVERAST